jgi:hypothetical protein
MFSKIKSLGLPLFAYAMISCAMISSANPSSACEIPEGWLEMTTDTPGFNKAAIRIPPGTVLLGQPFDVEFLTCEETSTPIKQVKVEATMPMHNHGMNYLPEITTTGENRYKATGMLFHMPGKWRISLETQGADKTDRFVLEISVK